MRQGPRFSDTQLARLENTPGEISTVTDPASLATYEIDGMRPAVAARAASAAEVAEIVRFAAEEKLAVIPCSGRSKLAIGGVPSHYDMALDLSAMNRVVSYDPGDLTLSVEPGVRIEDLQRELGQHGQFLPLEVAFSERATVGGAIATNAYSPLRAHFGSARDFVLGMEFVTGLGEIAKSGGRVVKNVTGYDLHKLLIGSIGTLAVITRVHFRTFPRPAEQRAFTATFASAREAHEYCCAVAASALEPHAVEMFDHGAAETSGLAAQSPAGARAWRVAVVAAGSAAVVERHARDLERMARESNATSFQAWSGAEAAQCFRAIQEFVRLTHERFAAAAIIRLALLPASAAALAERLAGVAAAHELEAALALGGAGTSGTGFAALWPRSADAADDNATASVGAAVQEVLRAAASDGRTARAFVEWCPTPLKQSISLWGEAREDFVSMQRVKQIFDSHGILAPGRYCGGL